MNIWRCNDFLQQEPCGTFEFMIIAFNCMTRDLQLRPVYLVMTKLFSSQASTTRVIWLWNDGLRLHCRMIIRATTKPVICRKSNLCPNQLRTPFVHSIACLQPLLQLGHSEIGLDAHKLRLWLCDEHFNRELFLWLELILDVQEVPGSIVYIETDFLNKGLQSCPTLSRKVLGLCLKITSTLFFRSMQL